MSYTVLARRYRPRRFEDLVGQEAVSATLSKAIASGRIAHAYLFCGTRGVGKTTSARIFAAAINAPEGETDLANVREAIFRGEDLDVQELDGASNRGINEAKEVIARSVIAPLGGGSGSASLMKSTCSLERHSMPCSKPWKSRRLMPCSFCAPPTRKRYPRPF